MSEAIQLTSDQARDLIQARYYDVVDRGDGRGAAQATHPEIRWSHVSAWNPDELGLSREAGPDDFDSREAMIEFFDQVVPRAVEAGLIHTVTEFVFDESTQAGAFLAETTSTKDDRRTPYMVWFSVRDGLMDRYVLRPI